MSGKDNEIINFYTNYSLSVENREKIEGWLDGKQDEKHWMELVLFCLLK